MNEANLILRAVDVARNQTRATLAYMIVGGWVAGVAAIIIRAVCTGQIDTASTLLAALKEVVILVVGFYFITQGVAKALNGGDRGTSGTDPAA